MSFTNGIGSLQQPVNSITQSDTKSTIEVTTAESLVHGNEKSIADVNRVDQANLSSVGGLVAQALEGPDIRSAKVASLQQAIGEGSYNVSSFDVADKLIQRLLE